MLNHLGPHDGIILFMDGVEVVAGTLDSQPLQSSTGNGRVDLYPSVQVDELVYFKSLLKTEEIEMLVKEV